MNPMWAVLCVILSSVYDVISLVSYHGIHGETILLTCDLQPTKNNRVIWKGPYDNATIAHSIYLNQHLPKYILDRLSVTDNTGKKTLRIVNVQPIDRGRYVCSVSNTAQEQEHILEFPALLSSSEPSYYRSLLVDFDKLIVGSMNSVHIIDLQSRLLANTTAIKFEPQKSDKDYCILSKPEKPYCQNHMRIISKRSGDMLIVCGTNADAPKGYEINITDTNQSPFLLGTVPCSNDPFSNFTAVHPSSSISTNHIYFGATNNGDSAISRQVYNSGGTVDDDVKGVISNIWMEEPQFAGSFDIGDKVYFFFREMAIEVDPAEPKMYSRVAKVCKKDIGGNSLLRNKWTSYQKARLNCSIPGKFPAYLDLLQDVVIKEDSIFYGLFTTQGPLKASAICAFNITAIESVFNEPFKEQASANSYWTKATNLPSPRPGQCTNDSLSLPNDVLQFIVDHPLMHQSVQPLYGKPIFVLDDEELQQLELHSNMTELVFYAASNNGKIYKLFSKDGVTYISSNYTTEDVIWSLKQHEDSVYIGTDTFVRQIKVINCEQYRWIDSCVRDPHCAWINETFENDIQCFNRCRSRSSLGEQNILSNVYTHENIDISKDIPHKCPPSIPTDLSVTMTWDTRLRIRWKPGYDGGLPQIFTIECRANVETAPRQLYYTDNVGSKMDPQYFELSNLSPGNLYYTRMHARNAVGNSSSTDEIIVGTGSSTQTRPLATSTKEDNAFMYATIVLGVIVGLLCLLVTILLIKNKNLKFRNSNIEQNKDSSRDVPMNKKPTNRQNGILRDNQNNLENIQTFRKTDMDTSASSDKFPKGANTTPHNGHWLNGRVL